MCVYSVCLSLLRYKIRRKLNKLNCIWNRLYVLWKVMCHWRTWTKGWNQATVQSLAPAAVLSTTVRTILMWRGLGKGQCQARSSPAASMESQVSSRSTIPLPVAANHEKCHTTVAAAGTALDQHLPSNCTIEERWWKTFFLVFLANSLSSNTEQMVVIEVSCDFLHCS